MTVPLYSLRGISKSHQHNAGFKLEIPRLDIMPGERLALAGPSGCGKSTALDILAAILQPDRADRFVFSPARQASGSAHAPQPVDIMAAWASKKRNALSAFRLHYLGYVLQTGGLLPFLTVRENIQMTRAALGLPYAQGKDNTVDDLCAALGISALQQALPGRLSVGERQRVAIARALASHPALVLADEPTAALDPPKAHSVMELFSRLTTHMGCTVVMVTHAPDLAAAHGFTIVPLHIDSQGEKTCSRLERTV